MKYVVVEGIDNRVKKAEETTYLRTIVNSDGEARWQWATSEHGPWWTVAGRYSNGFPFAPGDRSREFGAPLDSTGHIFRAVT